MQIQNKFKSRSTLYQGKSKGQLLLSFRQTNRNPQNEKKLIQRSLTKSYLATISDNKITQVTEDILKLKSNVIEYLLSAIQQKQDEQDQFQCQIDVQNAKIEESIFQCCGDTVSFEKIYKCKLSNSKSNELLIYHLYIDNLMWYFNFNVLLARIQPLQKQTQNHSFRMGQTYYLDFIYKGNKQFISFKKRLQNKIRMSDSIKYSINSIVSIPDFQFNKYKLERQFVKECKTGDILLFRNPQVMAKLQRFFTNSKYDHVGLVIRDPVYDILLYQSNGNTGVCLTPWKSLIKYKWYNIIKLVWRKLQGIDRNDDFIQQFHEFVMANINTKYHISFDKLLLRDSFVPKNQQQKGFFCSQLVARVYKQLKLLPTDKEQENYMPACNYYPVDFSEHKQLKLKKGSLSPQYQIVFDEKVLAADYS